MDDSPEALHALHWAIDNLVLGRDTAALHIIASAFPDPVVEHSIGVVAVGCRGMGVVRQALMSVAGLGSVSAYLSHHLSAGCSLVVVTHHQPAELAQPELNTR
ncbi:MAG: hypothetical protein WDW38_005858 [Sanguina aurantia]